MKNKFNRMTGCQNNFSRAHNIGNLLNAKIKLNL